MLTPTGTGKVPGEDAAKSAKRGRQGERTDDRLLDAIYQAMSERPTTSAAALYREMQADEELVLLLPAERAFRGHVVTIREQMDHGRWSPADVSDDEARLVLPIIGRMREVERPHHDRVRGLLADEAGDPRGRRLLAEVANLEPYWPTPRVAKWIARLRRWLPDLEGAGEYVVPASLYAAREARGAPTDDLDATVATIAARQWRKQEEP